VYVQADEAMLKQAVRILVENAQKYSPPDSPITLRAYVQSGSACLDVQDNGMGLESAEVQRIFERF
jgi:signal transduction histidine kinase